MQTPDGRPVCDIAVKIRSMRSRLFLIAYTNENGGFTFRNLPSGNYDISIHVPGYQPERRTVRLDSSPNVDIAITLKPEAGKTISKGAYKVAVRQLQIPEKAREEYRKALEDLHRGKPDKAIKHWEKSIHIYPQYLESYLHLSKIYVERKDYSRAVEMAQQAVAVDERNADALCILGYVYLKKKDLSQAKDAFERAIRLSDADWVSHFWLGWLLLKENDAAGAYAPIFRARQLRPLVPEVHILYFNDLLRLGRVKEALTELDDFLERFPDNPLATKVREKRDSLRKSVAVQAH